MAKIEKGDDGDEIINVSEKVGVRGTNDTKDVMAVQAMLNYMQGFHIRWTNVIVPEPNGSLDKKTQQAIFDYQQWV